VEHIHLIRMHLLFMAYFFLIETYSEIDKYIERHQLHIEFLDNFQTSVIHRNRYWIVVKIGIHLEMMWKNNEGIIFILEILILGKYPCKQPNS
jgi:hypothetical protein